MNEDDERKWREDGQEARHDRGDLGPNLLAREFDAVLQKQLSRRFEKIEKGTYGLRDATGAPISKGRLEAVPGAVYTAEAQRRREGAPLMRKFDRRTF